MWMKLRRRRNLIIISTATIFLIFRHFNDKAGAKSNRSSKHRERALRKDSAANDFGFKHFPPRYSPPYDPESVGHAFNVDRVTLEKIGMPLKDFTDIDEFNAGRFVVVTAASEEYLIYAMEAIGTIQYYLPKQPIIFYDLGGLSPKDIDRVSSLCDVTYKKFDATKFGSSVWDKRGYAWKPVIIHEALRENLGVLWIDSSVRFTSGNLTHVLRDVVRSQGALMMTSTGHSVYSATHPQMYQYLPTQVAKMASVDQHEAGCVFLYRTKQIYENILRWWVLCALDKNCIAPTKQLNCGDIYRGGKDEYANCHRFDQSALNILMANYFGFSDRKYYTSKEVSSIKRFHLGDTLVNVCKFGEKAKWLHYKTYLSDHFEIDGIKSVV